MRRTGRTWKALFKGLLLLGAFAAAAWGLLNNSLREASQPKGSLLPVSLKCHAA